MGAPTRMLKIFAADESGATAVEYSLIIGLIFLAILASINSVAAATTAMFNLISSAMS